MLKFRLKYHVFYRPRNRIRMELILLLAGDRIFEAFKVFTDDSQEAAAAQNLFGTHANIFLSRYGEKLRDEYEKEVFGWCGK